MKFLFSQLRKNLAYIDKKILTHKEVASANLKNLAYHTQMSKRYLFLMLDKQSSFC